MAQKVKQARGVRPSARSRSNAKPARVREPGVGTISSKNQLTIPVAALRRANLASGDRVGIDVDSLGHIRISPEDESPEDVVRRLAEGAFPEAYPEDAREPETEWPVRW
ncbi:MAG: AbrB/MazE/SpoVT family DNA-binding domain-containing protein [Actinobacteria bacterium]|nr:AbrB/MazE/SpoVT family DNA-binding domain-containing protein [Actinomycetota bacterium]